MFYFISRVTGYGTALTQQKSLAQSRITFHASRITHHALPSSSVFRPSSPFILHPSVPPLVGFQVHRAIGSEMDSLVLQLAALQFSGADFVRRQAAETIDDALPRHVRQGTELIEDTPYLPCAARRTDEERNLTVRQNTPAGNCAHDGDHALAKRGRAVHGEGDTAQME